MNCWTTNGANENEDDAADDNYDDDFTCVAS